MGDQGLHGEKLTAEYRVNCIGGNMEPIMPALLWEIARPNTSWDRSLLFRKVHTDDMALIVVAYKNHPFSPLAPCETVRVVKDEAELTNYAAWLSGIRPGDKVTYMPKGGGSLTGRVDWIIRTKAHGDAIPQWLIPMGERAYNVVR